MKTIRCPRCKRFYEYEGLPPTCCATCSGRESNEYYIVREYVKENKGATIQEVSQALGVPHAKIIQYLREERLEISKGSASFLRCMNCGRVITTGIRCEDCKKRYGYEMPSSIKLGL